MAMPALEQRRWTAAEVRALPEVPGKRFEVVDGELLVSPGPSFRHQFVLSQFFAAMVGYVHQYNIGALLWGPGELELDVHTLVQPDLFVVTPLTTFANMLDGDHRPILVIEALSPSTARFDRVVKRGRYQREGVEYWIVDFEARVVERWMPGATRPEIVAEQLEWQPLQVPNALVLDLPKVFAAALGA